MRFLFLISGAGMVLVGILAFLVWQRRKNIDVSFYLLGAAAWIVAVALKFATAIMFNEKIRIALEASLPKLTADIILYIYIGLLTGIFECGMVLLFLYLIKSLQKQTFNQAVAFGIGFGAVESILLGVISLISVSLIVLSPQSFPKEVLDKINPSKLWLIPAPVIERISTIFIHIFSTVLIVYGFLKKKIKWFWVSFFYKTLVDSFAACVALKKLGQTAMSLYLIEFEIAILGLLGFIGLKILKNKWPETESEE